MEIFRPYGFDKTLFVTVLILLALGLIMVYSSSAILAGERHQNTFHFFINQSIVAGIGLILIFLMLPVRKPFFQNTYFVYGLLFLSLLLLVLCLLMPALARTNRWIQFFGLRFQPSELAKLSLILFFAHYFNRKKERMNELTSLINANNLSFRRDHKVPLDVLIESEKEGIYTGLDQFFNRIEVECEHDLSGNWISIEDYEIKEDVNYAKL